MNSSSWITIARTMSHLQVFINRSNIVCCDFCLEPQKSLSPSKAMKLAEQGERSEGFFGAVQSCLRKCSHSPGLTGAITIVLPLRLTAGR